MTALSHKEMRRKRERADHTRRIRELNDTFRRSFSGGKSAGVYALPDMVKGRSATESRVCGSRMRCIRTVVRTGTIEAQNSSKK